MDKNIRVIARLDIKGPNVVKGVQFECLRVMGRPEDIAEEYYLQGADELIYLDTVASLYGRKNLLNIVERATEKIFIPFTAGGGVRTIEDIENLLRAGADKVAVNTAATKNPRLIKEASERFGSQCVVLSIEAKKISPGKWEAYTDNGRQKTGLNAVSWAKRGEELGAGEILLTSVDMEGAKNGLDLELVKEVSGAVSIPVIASGGAAKPEDFVDCFKTTDADAVAAASIFHYKEADIDDVKTALLKAGIKVRNVSDAKKKSGSASAAGIFDYNRFTLRQLGDENLGIDIGEERSEDLLKIGQKRDIGVINYKLNNVKSVLKAFERLRKSVKVIESPSEFKNVKCLVLPGVGAYEHGMNALKNMGLIEPLVEEVKSGKPFLGICLGMQLLFSESEEFGLHKGLDLISGRVVSFKKPSEVNLNRYKLPHIGWNYLKNPKRQNAGGDEMVYFVHSYYPEPEDQSVVAAVSEYGGQRFCSAVKKDNIFATQFHPERSGQAGLKILEAFCKERNL